MDVDTFYLIDRWVPWSSKALGDETLPDGECLERSPDRLAAFLRSNVDALTTDVELLGPNRFDDQPGPFTNFHAPTPKHYDYRLHEFIQDGGLERSQGPYRTDIVDVVEVLGEQLRYLDDRLGMFERTAAHSTSAK